MSIFKRGNVYWYHFLWDGQHVQRSTKQGNPRTARQIEAAYKTALAKGEVGITERKKIPAFKAAMEDFLAWSEQEHQAHPATHRRYQVSSIALLRHFKDSSLDAITPEDVERFKAARSLERKTARAGKGSRDLGRDARTLSNPDGAPVRSPDTATSGTGHAAVRAVRE